MCSYNCLEATEIRSLSVEEVNYDIIVLVFLEHRSFPTTSASARFWHFLFAVSMLLLAAVGLDSLGN